MADQLVEFFLLKSQATKQVDIATGELEYLHRVTEALNFSNGFVVDIAASDGFTQSPTLGFYKKGWSGLAVEMDPEKFSKLSFLYSDFERVSLVRGKITPINVSKMLQAFSCPKKFTILNLDIDSYDLLVLENLLEEGYKPQVISMEINEKIPSGLTFSVLYSETHHWVGDHFFGCSLDAAVNTIKPFGYYLVALEYNNAFFVDSDIAPNVFRDLNAKEAYEAGYKDREDRLVRFPFNRDVDYWLTLDAQSAMLSIIEYFSEYRGQFLLEVSSNE